MTKTRIVSVISPQGVSSSAAIKYFPSPFITSNHVRWVCRLEIKFELRGQKYALLATTIPPEALDLMTKNVNVVAKSLFSKKNKIIGRRNNSKALLKDPNLSTIREFTVCTVHPSKKAIAKACHIQDDDELASVTASLQLPQIFLSYQWRTLAKIPKSMEWPKHLMITVLKRKKKIICKIILRRDQGQKCISPALSLAQCEKTRNSSAFTVKGNLLENKQFCVKNYLNGIYFLLDSGAQVSLLPISLIKTLKCSKLPQAPSGIDFGRKQTKKLGKNKSDN
ncbi:unnamed protein product [Lepeophtheirus salmonis]|uniref:(salmon louse) hypothetical protein n=1 Tax=Lepeophtheirus salmonis TaxID=72036 RepID=A0A7R8D3K8_LEPSM|nr:unnamed protein product [Lepeophtheirus salmonis]CAF3013080.1 unnamed protein product [Lepeophtheirus salmonis]